MNVKSSRGALLALGIGAAVIAGLAPAIGIAQTAPRQLPANPQQPDRPAPPPPQYDRGDPRGFDRRANRLQDRLERRLDYLHSELRITPQQEQLWATFADAVRSEAQGARDQFFDRRDAFRGPDRRYERPGIVERLERQQQDLQDRSAYYDRLLTALRPLYAALNEDQRRAADENLFAPGREDRFRFGPRRFGMDRGPLGRDFDRYSGPDRDYR